MVIVMTDVEIDLETEAETQAFGRRLAGVAARGDVIGLSGPLGAGKTTLARGFLQAAAAVDEAPSPTFGFVETYDGAGGGIWHFDLYRLENAEDVWELGLEDALEHGIDRKSVV